MCCTWLAGNAGPKKSPKMHHLGTIVHLCRTISSQLRHVSTVGKKLVKQQYLLHMFWQQPSSGWDLLASLGHPCKFQRVSCLGSITARHSSSGRQQTLRHWTEGATYIRQGGHHVGHWPTFLVVWMLCILDRFLDCWLFCTAEQIRLLRERLELTGDFSVVSVVFCSITLEFGICKRTWKWETEWLLVALADESTQISENLASPIFLDAVV